MYWISIAALSAVHYFYRRGLQAEMAQEIETVLEADETVSEPETAPEQSRGAEVADAGQEGAAAAPAEDPDALSRDIDPLDLETNLQGVTDALERHTIYTRGIDLAYRKKNADPAMRTKAKTFAARYVAEFHGLKDAVFEALGESRYVSAFKQMAILLEEDEEYDKALSLCKKALLLGLDDGTKTGYQGRIDRINKRSK